MPAADVKDLAGRVLGLGVAIGAPEERWRRGIGSEVLDARGTHPAEPLTGERVDAVVGDMLGRVPHLAEAGEGL